MNQTIKNLGNYFKNLCIFTFVYIAIPMIFIKSGIFICSGKTYLGILVILFGYFAYSMILKIQKESGLFD